MTSELWQYLGPNSLVTIVVASLVGSDNVPDHLNDIKTLQDLQTLPPSQFIMNYENLNVRVSVSQRRSQYLNLNVILKVSSLNFAAMSISTLLHYAYSHVNRHF